jgi:hypothetical protein
MPNGAVEEIAVRGEGFSRFFARLTPRDLLERPTLFSSLIRNQLRLMASWFRSSPTRCWEPCLAPRAYANFVAGARFRTNCPVRRCFGRWGLERPLSPTSGSRSHDRMPSIETATAWQ